MTILRPNLAIALELAIEHVAAQEKSLGFSSDSCLLAGFKAVLAAVYTHEPIEVVDTPRRNEQRRVERRRL